MDNNNQIENKKADLGDRAQNHSFLNWKKSLFISLTLTITVVLTIITFVNVLKVNLFQTMGLMFRSLSTVNLAWLWFALLASYIFIGFFNNFVMLLIRIHRLKYKIPWFQVLLYAITISFLKAVTPSTYISDPYTVFWLKTNGVPLMRATSILFVHNWFCQIVQMTITLPSFIVMCGYYQNILLTNDGMGWIPFVCMIVGLSIDTFGLFGFLILCFSRRTHYYLALSIEWLKKILRFKKYQTKEELIKKYLMDAVLQRQCLEYARDWKANIVIVILFLFFEVLTYLSFYWSVVVLVDYQTISFWKIFHAINVSFTANKFIPIPGGEFSIEIMLKCFVTAMFDNDVSWLNKIKIDQDIAIWRVFAIYIPGIIGIYGFGHLTWNQIKNSYMQKKTN